MGQFKPLMSLGDRTILERVLALSESSYIDDIVVVIGHRAADMRSALAGRKVRCIENRHYQDGMFSSLLAGLNAISPQSGAFFVLPVDIPLVRPATIGRLIEAYKIHSEKQIFYPVFKGQRGHPPLIDAQLGPDIIRWQGQGGLRRFLSAKSGLEQEVPVADEAVLCDLDFPKDHQRLAERLAIWGTLPTPDEAWVMLTQVYDRPDDVVRHSQAVANVALALVRAVRRCHPALDEKLIFSAALLHDIGRPEPFHAAVGARWLKNEGFVRLSAIVRQHMDLDENPVDLPLSETQVVYLADKLVCGQIPMPLAERFRIQREKFENSPQMQSAMARRYRQAGLIQTKVEQAAGCSLAAVMQTAGLAWQCAV
jgi:molybdenum cofactor cytidylyltransferase